jgi:hypothetical protein
MAVALALVPLVVIAVAILRPDEAGCRTVSPEIAALIAGGLNQQDGSLTLRGVRAIDGPVGLGSGPERFTVAADIEGPTLIGSEQIAIWLVEGSITDVNDVRGVKSQSGYASDYSVFESTTFMSALFQSEVDEITACVHEALELESAAAGTQHRTTGGGEVWR